MQSGKFMMGRCGEPMKRCALYVLLLGSLFALAGCHGTLHSAAGAGDIATVRSLLAQGESVDKKNMGGFTPLMYAVGHADMVRLLLEKGANPDYKTRDGVTALHLAVEAGSVEGVRALLEGGTNPEAGYAALGLGSKGTPLTIAEQKGETKIAVLLRDAMQQGARQEKQNASRQKADPPSAVRTSDVDVMPTTRVGGKVNGYAIVIGIEQYRQKLPPADFAAHDAKLVAEYLSKVMGYPEENIVTIVNDHATKGDFEKYFEKWLPNNVEPGATVFVYYSGHGAPNPKTGDAYLVPYDGDPAFIDETGYSLKRLYAALGKLPAKEVIVALDSCFSGAGGRSVLAKGARPLVMNLDTAAAPAKNVTILAASSGSQISSTYDEQGHGLFTYFLLKSIKNEDVVRSDGSLKLKELYGYLRPQVEGIARKKYNNEQTPQLIEGKK